MWDKIVLHMGECLFAWCQVNQHASLNSWQVLLFWVDIHEQHLEICSQRSEIQAYRTKRETVTHTHTHTHNTHALHKENSHTHTMWLLFMKCGFEMVCMRTYSTFKTNLAGVKTQLLFITVDHTLPLVICGIARNSNCIVVILYVCCGDHIMDNTQVQLSLQTPTI